MALIVIVVHNLSGRSWEVVTAAHWGGLSRGPHPLPPAPRGTRLTPCLVRGGGESLTRELGARATSGSWSGTPSLEVPSLLPGALARMGPARWGGWWQRDQPRSGLDLVWSSVLGHSAEGTWVMVRGGLGEPLGRRQSRAGRKGVCVIERGGIICFFV